MLFSMLIPVPLPAIRIPAGTVVFARSLVVLDGEVLNRQVTHAGRRSDVEQSLCITAEKVVAALESGGGAAGDAGAVENGYTLPVEDNGF